MTDFYLFASLQNVTVKWQKHLFVILNSSNSKSCSKISDFVHLTTFSRCTKQKVHSWKSFPCFQFCVRKIPNRVGLILNFFEIIWRMKMDRIARPKFIYSVCRTWRGRERCQSISRSSLPHLGMTVILWEMSKHWELRSEEKFSKYLRKDKSRPMKCDSVNLGSADHKHILAIIMYKITALYNCN